jgi:pilus assembly protein CpaB
MLGAAGVCAGIAASAVDSYTKEAGGDRGQSPPAALGGRLVEVPVAGAETISGALRPGSRVDVLITTERGVESSRTYLALQRVELVDFQAGAPATAGASDDDGHALATLRVTLRQAVLLTAARNFARELRLVPRATGDDRKLRPAVVTAPQLGG